MTNLKTSSRPAGRSDQQTVERHVEGDGTLRVGPLGKDPGRHTKGTLLGYPEQPKEGGMGRGSTLRREKSAARKLPWKLM